MLFESLTLAVSVNRLPKAALAGFADRVVVLVSTATPAPVALRGAVPAELTTLMVAERAPVFAGEKMAPNVQVLPGANVWPVQLSSTTANSAGTVEVTDVIVVEATPVLVAPTVCCGDPTPTAPCPKASVAGRNVICAFCTPVPFNVIVCGLPGAVSDSVSVAVREPAAPGVNVICSLQLELALSVTPVQASEVIVKSDILVPEIATLLMV